MQSSSGSRLHHQSQPMLTQHILPVWVQVWMKVKRHLSQLRGTSNFVTQLSSAENYPPTSMLFNAEQISIQMTNLSTLDQS